MNKKLYQLYIIGILCLSLWFSFQSNIKNKAPFVIDSFEYHVLGVNLSKGLGFNTMGIYGDLQDYKFNFDANSDVTYPTSPLLFKIIFELKDIKYFFRDPGYSLFLGTIYSLLGVNPASVFYIQILLLALSLSLVPYIFYKCFGPTGFKASLLAGVIMFFYFKSYTLVYLTEIFQIFLLCLATFLLLQNKNRFLLLLSFLMLGLNLITKGSIYLITPFLIIFAWQNVLTKNKTSSILAVVSTLLIPLTWTFYANYHDINNKDLQLIAFHAFSNSNIQDLSTSIQNSSINENDKARILASDFDLQNEKDQSQVYFDEGIKLMLKEAFFAKDYFFVSRRFSYSLIDCNNEYLIDEENPHWIKWRLIEDNFYLNGIDEGKTQLHIILQSVIQKPILFFKLIIVKVLYFLKTFEFILFLSMTTFFLTSLFLKKELTRFSFLLLVFMLCYILTNTILKNSNTFSLINYLSLGTWFVWVIFFKTFPLWKNNFIVVGLIFSLFLFSFVLFPVDRIIAVFLFLLFPLLFIPSIEE